ncbi:coiled-coil domain-containing protein 125-like isoform X2 [Anneissia japonica]|uniref:coiled-coil domain-containing protein 125-like isoform X2 n=1 Tax=Anneissia japonica TaxID=1529436 RepID=UPI001425B674|nr:coiled-coil domain-containing protein 125-like isoform X2 [Anneissia japonica]
MYESVDVKYCISYEDDWDPALTCESSVLTETFGKSSSEGMSMSSCDTCSTTSSSADDSFNLTRGDLGLGYGLKPGSLIRITQNNINSPCWKCRSAPRLKVNISGGNGINHVWTQALSKTQKEDIFPMMDGVQIGTSIRQQKKLYEHNMREVNFKREQEKINQLASGEDSGGMTSQELTNASRKFIQQKLSLAAQEVEVLQNELDACKSQLDSKYKAIRILQSQAMLAASQHKRTAQSSIDHKKDLVKEVNALQFELDIKADAQLRCEHNWAERFDRMCLENAALMATLEARSDELRRIQAENIGLCREKEELLSVMDVKDKLVYEKHKAINDEAMEGFAPSLVDQVAVLGLCKCSCSAPDPCKCAKMAAHFKKENAFLKEQTDVLKVNCSESYSVADAYRIAFEEQLNRNTVLSKEIAEFHKDRETNRLKLWKNKNTHTNVFVSNCFSGPDEEEESQEVSQLGFGEEYHSDRKARSLGVQATEPNTSEFINLLSDLLNDRSEALAHQRLAARLLANRMRDLEEILERLTINKTPNLSEMQVPVGVGHI